MSEHFYGLGFWVLFSLFHVGGQIAVAELLDDVVVPAALHNFVEANDVFGVHLFQDVYLDPEGNFQIIVLVN